MTSRASQPLPAYSICLAARSHGQDGVCWTSLCNHSSWTVRAISNEKKEHYTMPRGPTTIPAHTHPAAPSGPIRPGISRTTESRSTRPCPFSKCQKVPGPCRAGTQTASGCAWPTRWGQGRHMDRSTPVTAPQRRGQTSFCPDRHAVCPQSAGRRGKCIQEHRHAGASNRQRPIWGQICSRQARKKNIHWSKNVSNKIESIQTTRK